MIQLDKMVSCILPTFRGSKWANARLEEIEKQLILYSNIEAIVVADGVKFELYKDYKFPIKVIHLHECSNSVSIPRAIGITHSSGEFIAPVDDDVIILQNKFIDLTRVLSDPKISLGYGNMVVYSIEGHMSYVKKDSWAPSQGWGIDSSQIIYRKSVYETMPLVFARRACDWETALQIEKNGGQLKHIDATVSVYIWHDTNRSNNEKTKLDPIFPGKFKQYFNKEQNFLMSLDSI